MWTVQILFVGSAYIIFFLKSWMALQPLILIAKTKHYRIGEFDHIWLGARWIPNEWVWLNNHSVPLPSENKKYPPWCDSSLLSLHEENEDCLNLDRDAHNMAVIYGYNCSVKQSFVCQLDAFDFLDAPYVGDDYHFYRTGLSHVEAEWACKMNHSHLALLNNMQLAQRVAMLLPRETLVWVGGRRMEGTWRWLKTREIISDTIGEDGYPPWGSYATAIGTAVCLAVKSGYREQPLFIEKPCREKLPYMCQFDQRELPQPDLILDLNEIKYYFYQKGVPWHEAMSICNSGNLYLINVGNLELANFLLEGMRDTNPQWTSGRQLSEGSWSWTTSGAKLPNEIKRGYPPWLNNTVARNMDQTCLMLAKLNELPLFAGEDCGQNHSFVCVDKIPTNNETEIEIENITISLKDIITSIANAKEACLKSGKTLVDFSKMDTANLIKLFKMENVKSLWVDVIHNEKGKWVYADTLQEFKTEIDFPAKDNHPIHDQKSCLTLQMTPDQKLVLNPALCSDFSRIICMASEEQKLVAPRVVKILNETVTFTAIFENSTLAHSSLVCNDIGGDVIQGSLEKDAVDFFKTLPPEYTHFWLGASYDDKTWRWDDGTPVQVNVTELPTASDVNFSNQTVDLILRNCLIYNRTLDHLQAVECFDKYSTLCETVQATCEPKKDENSVEWSPQKCSTQNSPAGTVCRAACPPHLNLLGPEMHVCTKGKWTYNLTMKCQIGKKQGKSLEYLSQKSIVQETTRSYFLIVLDCGIKKKEFLKLLQFAKNLGNTMLLNSRRRLTIELYSYNSKVIDLLENNNCYFMHTVDRLVDAPQLSNSVPNYLGAFLTAEEEFNDKEVQYSSAYIFFFAMRPDKGSMNRTIVIDRLKQKGVTIIVISVGEEINRSQLEEMASLKYDELQLYMFRTMDDFQAASTYLKTKSKIRVKDCPREFIG